MARPITKFTPITKTYVMLEEGMVFKNYKELCLFLEQPVVDGGSKRSQLEMFQRYFEYSKDGYKFTITHVYLEPLTLEQFDTDGIYSGLIQKLLLDYLEKFMLSNSNKPLLLSKSQMYELLGLITEDYIEYRDNKNELCKILNISKDVVNEFYTFTSSRLYGYCETALRSLVKRSVINIKPNTFILNVGRRATRLCDEFEEKEILTHEYDVMRELSVKHKISTPDAINHFIIINAGLWRTLTDEVSRRLKDSAIPNLNYYYRGYEIVLTKNITSEKERVNRYILDNRADILEVLNTTVVNKYKESYRNRHEKAKDIVGGLDIDMLYDTNEDDGGKNTDFKIQAQIMRSNPTYPENGSKLIDKTMSIKNKANYDTTRN
jgi:hypothetical protein